jgi:hypothetical protein
MAKSLTLTKEPFCRVSDIWHSEKHMTIGKALVSRSDVFFANKNLPCNEKYMTPMADSSGPGLPSLHRKINGKSSKQ